MWQTEIYFRPIDNGFLINIRVTSENPDVENQETEQHVDTGSEAIQLISSFVPDAINKIEGSISN